jgi:mono/diheme cytochrome c family protein
MKKIAIISGVILVSAATFTGCSSKREPGRIYMPDMAYSRAYETYAERDSTKFTTDPNNKGGLIYYDNKAVQGTMKRGEELPYTLPNDSNGYKMSATVKNPFDSISAADLAESGRLFNINCGVCHGEKATGNGPIASKIGAVANLTLEQYQKMADGTMFHSITYGKNNMGSYASQLDRRQRWMIVKYIRSLQPKQTAAAPATDSTGKAKTATPSMADSTSKKTK